MLYLKQWNKKEGNISLQTFALMQKWDNKNFAQKE
jgi:hypothetical protein